MVRFTERCGQRISPGMLRAVSPEVAAWLVGEDLAARYDEVSGVRTAELPELPNYLSGKPPEGRGRA